MVAGGRAYQTGGTSALRAASGLSSGSRDITSFVNRAVSTLATQTREDSEHSEEGEDTEGGTEESEYSRLEACEAKIILFGNPGAGKSFLGNCLFGKAIFTSDLGCVTGITKRTQEKTHGGKTIVDTPGLADGRKAQRKKAVDEINALLTKGGALKIIFVIRDVLGRISEEDLATMRLILEAAPQIGPDGFGIIVNQCIPKVISMPRDGDWKVNHQVLLLAGLVNGTKHILYLPRVPSMEGERNVVAEFRDLDRFVEELRPVTLTPGGDAHFKPITSDDFFDMKEKVHDSQDKREYVLARKKMRKDWEEKGVQEGLANANTIATIAVVGVVVLVPAFLSLVGVALVQTWDMPVSANTAIRFQQVLIPYLAAYILYRLYLTVKSCYSPVSMMGQEDWHLLQWKKVAYPCANALVKACHIWFASQILDAISDVKTLWVLLSSKAEPALLVVWAFTTLVSMGVPCLFMCGVLSIPVANLMQVFLEDIFQAGVGMKEIFDDFRLKTVIESFVVISTVLAILGILERIGGLIQALRGDYVNVEEGEVGEDD